VAMEKVLREEALTVGVASWCGGNIVPDVAAGFRRQPRHGGGNGGAAAGVPG